MPQGPGDAMNEVVVSRSELTRVAGQAEDAADIVGRLGVSEHAAEVRTAMPGSTSGSEAVSAGLFIDGLSDALTAALGHFTASVRTAAENYDETDQSASLSIAQVLEELGD